MRVVLFAPIEANQKDINTTKDGFNRYFEDEAIKAFACWRNNAGCLKDIPIYAICPTKATISEYTRARFRELNVTYIEAYQQATDEFTCGFWNIPLVGQWAEDHLQADILIKIDLDMYLIRPLPDAMFDNISSTIVGLHDHLAEAHLASISGEYPAFQLFFNTGFTVSTPASHFFRNQLSYLMELERQYSSLSADDFRKRYGLTVGINVDRDDPTAVEHRLFEELCVSLMYQDGIPITPIRNYYLETNEYELDGEVDFDLTKVYFIHEHIDSNLSQTNLVNQLKYRRKFGSLPGYDFFLQFRTR